MRFIVALFLFTLVGANTAEQASPKADVAAASVVPVQEEASTPALRKVQTSKEAETQLAIADEKVGAVAEDLSENTYLHTGATADALAFIFAAVAIVIVWIECCGTGKK